MPPGWDERWMTFRGQEQGSPMSQVEPWQKGGTQGDFIFWKMSLCS